MKINYQRIYEKLGFLFYAIAAADNVVTPAEISRLEEMVKKIWVPIENTTDEFGTDAAQYISISFEYLMNEGVEADMAFEEFSNYYQDHSPAFSNGIKESIKMTAHAIAEAFKGENALEHAYLERLEKLLQ